MTTVNVTTTKNTVSVTEQGATTVVETPVTSVVTATTVGPQGPKGISLDDSAKVDNSIVYYDSSSGEFKADATWTIQTLVTGGNF
jgi:hypothetical protein|tara:strand:+ start:7792 stop:8046 length:255 start_codon:yes stop_codon:yes gene_type:complete